jgi:hypothetical protein
LRRPRTRQGKRHRRFKKLLNLFPKATYSITKELGKIITFKRIVQKRLTKEMGHYSLQHEIYG